MGNCGKITASILNDCNNPLIGGVSDELILINKEDIIDYEVNVDNPQIIEGINLVTSPATRAYKIEGYKSSVEPQVDLVPNQYRSSWAHQVLFRVFSNTPETKEVIEGIKDGTLVAIVKNNNQGVGGNAVYELFGKGVGLYLKVATSAKNDSETQGAYILTLATPDNQKEPKVPATIYNTDLATTVALVNALL